MDLITIFRFLLIPIGIGTIFLAVKLIKPPKKIIFLALSLCWVAGGLNLIVDIIQQNFGIWQYAVPGLVLGYPIDLYVAVSLVLGGAAPLIYWWLRSYQKKWLLPFLFLLPCYLLLQDYLVITLTGNAVIQLQNSYWWLVDFVALIVITWGTLFVFRCFLSDDSSASASPREKW